MSLVNHLPANGIRRRRRRRRRRLYRDFTTTFRRRDVYRRIVSTFFLLPLPSAPFSREARPRWQLETREPAVIRAFSRMATKQRPDRSGFSPGGLSAASFRPLETAHVCLEESSRNGGDSRRIISGPSKRRNIAGDESAAPEIQDIHTGGGGPSRCVGVFNDTESNIPDVL